MIRRIKGIFLQIKFRLIKKSRSICSDKNNEDAVNQLIEKGLIPDKVRDQYLKDNRTLNTSKLIEVLIKKRIADREKETSKRYSKMISEILNEKINR